MAANEKKMNFVATRLSLPLFMVTRNSFKTPYELHRLREYIDKNKPDLTKYCQTENASDNATFRRFRGAVGRDTMEKYPYPQPYPLKTDRSLTTYRTWQLAPNRYGVPEPPFEERVGDKGAIFARVHTSKSTVQRKKGIWRYYNIPSEIDRLFKPQNAKKGIFLTNARQHRPTSRSMVSDPMTCYRNPNDPGSTHYHTRYYEFSYNLIPPRIEPKPNPHIFNRHSCVPAIRNSLYKRHISFLPGPGRYDTANRSTCPCDPKKTYMPQLQLLIDKQKRLKFRRQPYMKIKKRLYCAPDWQHVPGKGHRWLFKYQKKVHTKGPKRAGQTKKSEKQLQLYVDAKYINLITNPNRHPISIRDKPVPPYVPKIVYNSIAKRAIRKQVRNNKKIAFNSGQERFKDSERPLTLTAKQLAAIREGLPPERQLQDYPIFRKSKTEIVSRYLEVPDHMRPQYVPKLRKRLFKFLPLPGAKVLVRESDIRAEVACDVGEPTGFFRKPLDERSYFRKSVLDAEADIKIGQEDSDKLEEEGEEADGEDAENTTTEAFTTETEKEPTKRRVSVRLKVDTDAENEEDEA